MPIPEESMQALSVPSVASDQLSKPSVRAVAAVLGAAAVYGLAADLGLRGAPAGLNVLFAVAGLAAWATFLSHLYARTAVSADAWHLPAVVFAAGFALRDSEPLLFLDALALLAALALPLVRAAGWTPWRASLTSYARAAVALGWHTAVGWLPLLVSDVQWDAVGRRGALRRIGPVAAGIVVAVPVVAIFGALFSSADPVFGALAETVLSLDLGPVFAHVVFATVCAALAAGYLRARLWGVRPVPARGVRLRAQPAFAPVAVVLGTMVGMFTVFVAIQSRYLFGGAAYVRETMGLTVAEYARSGFFECVTAAGLAVPLLLVGDWLVGRSDPRALRSFRALGVVQLLLIGAVLASAVGRMGLYVSAFGLTQDRIIVFAVLVWLSAVTTWLGLTVLRGRRSRFAFGSVVSGFTVLGALNLANPDALVARVNIGHDARALDTVTLNRLGADASPTIVARLASLPAEVRCSLALAQVRRWGTGPAEDLRGWNWSRYAARRAAAGIDLTALGCMDRSESMQQSPAPAGVTTSGSGPAGAGPSRAP